MSEEKNNTTASPSPQAAPAAPQEDPNTVDLTLNDLAALKSIIDVASNRGAFKPNEMVAVGSVYTKLEKFLDIAARLHRLRRHLMLKHVGKMKHNDAKICVVYRTLPGDSHSALVVGTSSLVDQYHNSLMQVVESQDGQQANELGDALSTRFFPDGTNMLEQLHLTGKLVKVATDKIWMTPDTVTTISLDELNVMIAEQKGVSLDDLSIKADMPHVKKQGPEEIKVETKDLDEVVSSTETLTEPKVEEPESASAYRSKADKLYKEAARLRKMADELDPPKKKATSVKKNAETT